MRAWYVITAFLLLMNASQAQQKIVGEENNQFEKITRCIQVQQNWQIIKPEFLKAELTKKVGGQTASIYLHSIEYKGKKDSLEVIVKDEMDSYREFGSDQFSIKPQKPIIIDNGKSIAIIKHITGASDAAYQAIAYIPENKSVLSITLITDSHQLFLNSIKEFETIVKSYSVDIEQIKIVTKNTFY